LRELLGAERVIVMANGTSKVAIVAAAVEKPASVDLPAT
jgi:6-phosphogluconolactonase/glucosamine-6-phosphate isomerase/deaminase